MSGVKKNDPIEFLLNKDPYLRPYRESLSQRSNYIDQRQTWLISDHVSLIDVASAHQFYGLHADGDKWVFREWAPNAIKIYLIGTFTAWQESEAFVLERINENGDWQIRLPRDVLNHGDLYRLVIHWPGGRGDRIPAYARRVVQDPVSLMFNAQVWPSTPYDWKYPVPTPSASSLFIYEAHVGMAQEEGKIGSYEEFRLNILPRIVESGYDTLQLMAIQEHPYYASFGYHVSSFFAVSSRFGTPEELKQLIDEAHGAGLRVIMDLVHSHSVSNEVEGLSRFDGTLFQYFHDNPRGYHEAWDSRCFDYGKRQVLEFLLSNCRYWLEEFHLDGFRFDGITSMLYLHHGLGKSYIGYEDYFDQTVDIDALAYLSMANSLIHDLNASAIVIAEDMSGMPGLVTSKAEGGIGFDFRLAMGVPDFWIKLIKDYPDDLWPLETLWYELNNRRPEEKTISYAESHDQALVGDQTIFFRLAGEAVYHGMGKGDANFQVERAVALHKLVRLITLATAGNAYLNFMGNEFGHPEWIDFPRKENNWSYHFARRQWHLVDDPELRYQQLYRFDRAMIRVIKQFNLLESAGIKLWHEHVAQKIIAFQRAELFFVFNFHPDRSYSDCVITAPPGKYQMILDSDSSEFGGLGRLLPDQELFTRPESAGSSDNHFLSLYLPTRTSVVLKKID